MKEETRELKRSDIGIFIVSLVDMTGYVNNPLYKQIVANATLHLSHLALLMDFTKQDSIKYKVEVFEEDSK